MSFERVREAVFGDLAAAYMRRDYHRISHALAQDVVLELSGSTPYAGTHLGIESVKRCTEAMRGSFEPSTKPLAFTHEGNEMVVEQAGRVRGEWRTAEMLIRLRITFDDEGRLVRVRVEPEDQETFDVLAQSVFEDSDTRCGPSASTA